MERCNNAYRKRGKNAVFCKAIPGDQDYCIYQKACMQTQRMEVLQNVLCKFKNQQPVKQVDNI